MGQREVSRRALLGGIFSVPAGAVLWAMAKPADAKKAGGLVKLVQFSDKGERKGVVQVPKVVKPEAEWKQMLTPEQYHVAREKGTERAFTGEYATNHDKGLYQCVCCGNALFKSETKFESGTGWPSFYAPIAKENVTEETDSTFGMRRTEVMCTQCDAHLGHVFDDGPRPTGLRYCMNSASLKFIKA